MNTITTLGGLALAAVLAVAGCKSDVHEAQVAATNQQTGPIPEHAAPTPGAAQVGQNLASFDLVFGSGDGYLGRYVRTGPNTWTGPNPQDGAPVTWTATTFAESPESVVLDSGAVRLNVNVSTGEVASSVLDPSFNYRIASPVFQ